MAIEVSWGSLKKSLQPAPTKMRAANASSCWPSLASRQRNHDETSWGDLTSDRAGLARF